MHNLTTDTFDEFLAGSPVLTVIDFWAPWCGPCKQMNPVLAELDAETPDVRFAKVNVDEEPSIAQRFSIRSIPTFLFFKDGELLDGVAGARSLHEFRSLIAALK